MPAGSSPPATAPRQLDPRVVRVWAVGAALFAAVVVLAAAVVDLAVPGVPGPGGGLTAVVAVIAAGVAWWYPRAAYERWSYVIGPDSLELRHGVVFRTESAIPYFRVQHVDISQGPIDRLLGVSRLVVRTASASTDESIPGIDSAHAIELRARILDRSGVGDAV